MPWNQTPGAEGALHVSHRRLDRCCMVHFDGEARHRASVSGEELLQRWDTGEYSDISNTTEGRSPMRFVILIPFGRQECRDRFNALFSCSMKLVRPVSRLLWLVQATRQR